MATTSEDAIIRRKLLVEGESGLDDRRFGVLLKDYLHWATSDETPEAGKLQKMRTELNNLENINRMYDERISLRRKQFHLFLVALRDLQKLVEQDTPIVDPDDQKNVTMDEAMDTA
ncbi:unnamed protein product [Taenia asiatica]|uniref:THO complex subunit 7 n=1 Tax=Taenia asiatica TaxID=60517 RepID=A0A0R3VT57_TAEAS|nr:unnamed protein product [Taenia asiatica]